MNTHIRNQQSQIAEQFNRADRHLTTRSKRALLKVQSWNLSLLPGTDDYFKKQVKELVTESLLTYVSSGYILLQENFHDGPLEELINSGGTAIGAE